MKTPADHSALEEHLRNQLKAGSKNLPSVSWSDMELTLGAVRPAVPIKIDRKHLVLGGLALAGLLAIWGIYAIISHFANRSSEPEPAEVVTDSLVFGDSQPPAMAAPVVIEPVKADTLAETDEERKADSILAASDKLLKKMNQQYPADPNKNKKKKKSGEAASDSSVIAPVELPPSRDTTSSPAPILQPAAPDTMKSGEGTSAPSKKKGKKSRKESKPTSPAPSDSIR